MAQEGAKKMSRGVMRESRDGESVSRGWQEYVKRLSRLKRV